MWVIFALLDPDPQNLLKADPKNWSHDIYQGGWTEAVLSTLNSTFQTFLLLYLKPNIFHNSDSVITQFYRYLFSCQFPYSILTDGNLFPGVSLPHWLFCYWSSPATVSWACWWPITGMQLVESFRHVIGPDLLTEHTNWLIVLYNPPITSWLSTIACSLLVRSFVASSFVDGVGFKFQSEEGKNWFYTQSSVQPPQISLGGGGGDHWHCRLKDVYSTL